MDERNDMINPAKHIHKIYVAKDCQSSTYTKEILARAPAVPVEIVTDARIPAFDNCDYSQSLSGGKKNLLLCKNLGHFLKPCPGTREYRCCDYQVLNIGMNCPMDCVYCILQAYLNNPWLSFFVNVDDLLMELGKSLDVNSDTFMRIGTGEFTDSLALDQLTGLSKVLVEFMADKKNAVLELKTKSAAIENLEGLNHQDRTVVAWSLNGQSIMKKEELRTATLEERLAAAKKCAEWGYKLAFHFDPIIYYPNWQAEYADTINKLFSIVPRNKIAWISMGALRFLPNLKKIASDRFPSSRFFYEEFVMGLDGKYRYFRPQRTTMYKHIYSLLKQQASPETCIYLCMESDEIWRDVFGYTPDEKGGLAAMLDEAVSG